jgi:hypothetical protein
MNKSYSKIRHIQEVNKLIEKRMIMEVEGDPIFTEDSYEKLGQELGTTIEPDLENELDYCSIDEIGSGFNLKPEAKELLDKVKLKIKELINTKNREGLKSFWSELSQKIKGQPTKTETTEQAEVVAAAVTILGISAPMWVWIAIGAIALTLIIKGIVSLTSWIPKKKGKGCKRTITYRVR